MQTWLGHDGIHVIYHIWQHHGSYGFGMLWICCDENKKRVNHGSNIWETIFSMAISETDLLEVPTIYKAYFSGLCKGIYPQNMDPEIPIDFCIYLSLYLHVWTPGPSRIEKGENIYGSSVDVWTHPTWSCKSLNIHILLGLFAGL